LLISDHNGISIYQQVFHHYYWVFCFLLLVVQDRGVDFRRFSGSCPFLLLLSHPKGMTATDDGVEEDVINDESEDGLEEDDVWFEEVEEEGFEAAERSFDEFFDDPPAQRPGSLLLLPFCSWKMERINISPTNTVHNDLH
jgi:hypothetical protein